jgi:hypothetical protein
MVILPLVDTIRLIMALAVRIVLQNLKDSKGPSGAANVASRYHVLVPILDKPSIIEI